MTKNDINTLWKKRHAQKVNTARDTIHYCILRAILSKAEDKTAIARHLIHKAFKPVTNENKLANGAIPFQVLNTYPNYQKPNMVLGLPITSVLSEDQITLFNEILTSFGHGRNLVRNYAYFFTRQDIFDEYQLVQTAHAALELGHKLTAEQVKELHFTVCGVPDLEALEAMELVLQSLKLKYVVFREPDIGNQKTSIGVYPIEEHKRGVLRTFNLLRFNRN